MKNTTVPATATASAAKKGNPKCDTCGTVTWEQRQWSEHDKEYQFSAFVCGNEKCERSDEFAIQCSSAEAGKDEPEVVLEEKREPYVWAEWFVKEMPEDGLGDFYISCGATSREDEDDDSQFEAFDFEDEGAVLTVTKEKSEGDIEFSYIVRLECPAEPLTASINAETHTYWLSPAYIESDGGQNPEADFGAEGLDAWEEHE